MDLDFDLIKSVLKSDGTYLRDFNGRAKTPDQFAKICFDIGMPIHKSKAHEAYQACVKHMAPPPKEPVSEKSAEEVVKQSLNPQEIFKDFELLNTERGAPLLRYTHPVTQERFLFGSLPDMTPEKLLCDLLSFGRPTLEAWKNSLTPHAKFLKITL